MFHLYGSHLPIIYFLYSLHFLLHLSWFTPYFSLLICTSFCTSSSLYLLFIFLHILCFMLFNIISLVVQQIYYFINFLPNGWTTNNDMLFPMKLLFLSSPPFQILMYFFSYNDSIILGFGMEFIFTFYFLMLAIFMFSPYYMYNLHY